jgi:rhodanese-related sulfurtransferase
MESPIFVVDVRTPAEFMGGHVAGSINIPLNELPQRITEVKGKSNLILCCASGARSEQAARYLKSNGIDCENGGPWVRVNAMINNQH